MGGLVFTRQEGILPSKLLSNSGITLVGAGAIGSFSTLTLSKMGVKKIVIYDEDGISDHNLPNQFYRKRDVGQFKVDALKMILSEFGDSKVISRNKFYSKQKLEKTTIVAPDSMSSRRLVWEQFKHQPQAINFIEARMGAELGMIYTVRKVNGKLREEDEKFYESRLYNDDVAPISCTARSIIYNVLMISSLICRAYKSIVTARPFPREVIFNMTNIDERSYMIKQ